MILLLLYTLDVPHTVCWAKNDSECFSSQKILLIGWFHNCLSVWVVMSNIEYNTNYICSICMSDLKWSVSSVLSILSLTDISLCVFWSYEMLCVCKVLFFTSCHFPELSNVSGVTYSTQNHQPILIASLITRKPVNVWINGSMKHEYLSVLFFSQ